MKTNVLLLGVGTCILVLCYVGGMGAGKRDFVWFVPLVLLQGAFFAFASYLAFKGENRRATLIIIIAFGVVFRAVVLPSAPFASSDIYRYVWDGRVVAAGLNPYAYIPADKRLAGLRDGKIYPSINRRSTAHTIYPPVAQGAFYLASRFGAIFSMKAMMVGFDLVTVLVLMRLLFASGVPLQRIILYAWHPLIIWEFAGNGHVDALAIVLIATAFLAYRFDRRFLVGAALAAAALVKFLPLVLLAPLYRRWDWKMPLAFGFLAVAVYVPFLSIGMHVLGYLPGYVHEEGMDTGQRFYLLNMIHTTLRVDVSPIVYVAASALFILGLWIFVQRIDSTLPRIREFFALVVATAITVLLSPAYPWYFTWLVPLCVLCNSRAVLYLTLLAPILYVRELFDSSTLVLILDTILFVPTASLAVRSLLRDRYAILSKLEAHA